VFVAQNESQIAYVPETIKRHAVVHESLDEKLFNEIRILCYVFTHPDNHKTKAVHVKNTWGKRCNKLLFMSTQVDAEIPEIVALPNENGRKNLWIKTNMSLFYIYQNHFHDADWFLRADDDK
jgi:glycoprotein-N-acetylgalactosamine 3-beta-galactosyltransferase